MHRFVVAVQVVVPNGAASTEREGGCFIGNPRFLRVRNDESERYSIVEGADFDGVIEFSVTPRHQSFCSMAMIDCFGMNAPPGIFFVDLIGFGPAKFASLAQIAVIEDHSQPRRLDDGASLESHFVEQ